MILIKEMILNEIFYLLILIYLFIHLLKIIQYLVYLNFIDIDELSGNNNELRSKF